MYLLKCVNANERRSSMANMMMILLTKCGFAKNYIIIARMTIVM